MPMDVTQPDLSKLHDIHLPSAISWWPPAPGWFFLLLLGMGIFVCTALWILRHYQRGKAKRQALTLLRELENQFQLSNDAHVVSMHISSLLRQVALAYFPRSQVAGLIDEAWLDFLNRTAPRRGWDAGLIRKELLILPYHPQPEANMALLFRLSREWIKGCE